MSGRPCEGDEVILTRGAGGRSGYTARVLAALWDDTWMVQFPDGVTLQTGCLRRTAPGFIVPGNAVVGRAGTPTAGSVGAVLSTYGHIARVRWAGSTTTAQCSVADIARVAPEDTTPAGGTR